MPYMLASENILFFHHLKYCIKMADLLRELLLLLIIGISSTSGYAHIGLTASPQYVSSGGQVQFDCIFKTDQVKPTYTRMVLSTGQRTAKEVPNDQIKWESSGGIHYTSLEYSTEIYNDETYICTAHFDSNGDSGRQLRNAPYKVTVCCPLRIESKKLVIDVSQDVYGLDITVSGNDVGEGTVMTTNTDSPVSVTVTSSEISGRFQLGQTQAKLFSLRWTMNQEGTESCADQGGASNDYIFRVNGKEKLENYKEVPFKTLYPALWNRIADRVKIVSQSERYNKSLRCDVCAFPPPTITWYLCGDSPPPDVIISQSGAELTIPEVQERHVGVYVCTATNNINDQRWTKKFELKLYLNGSDTEPSCLRDARVKTFVIPTIIVIVLAVIVCIICWKCQQIQDFCQGLKDHVTSDPPKDYWTGKAPPATAQERQPDAPDVLPTPTPEDKPPEEPAAEVEGIQYAVLDEIKPRPGRTATLPRADDEERVEYATVVSGNN